MPQARVYWIGLLQAARDVASDEGGPKARRAAMARLRDALTAYNEDGEIWPAPNTDELRDAFADDGAGVVGLMFLEIGLPLPSAQHEVLRETIREILDIMQAAPA